MKTISQIILEMDSLMSSVPGQNGQESENLRYLREIAKSYEAPVKVVVMGEVKAGKSTFINSILQREISCMNAAETTAVLHHFVYSEESYGCIIRKDGSYMTGTVEEVQAIIQTYSADREFIAGCEAVEFGLPLSVLEKFDLVDTPGIATITEENEALTLEYIAQADIILWVFNSHYIGQSNVREAVLKVMEEGKEVIGILNRMDEVELTEEELISNASRWIPFIKCFYPLSAYNALKSASPGEDYDSNLAQILEEIQDFVGEEEQETKKRAVTASLCSLIERESMWQWRRKVIAGEIISRLKGHQHKLQAAHEELSGDAYKSYLNWLEKDFMLSELNEFYQAKNNKEELLRLQDIYFKEEYINKCMADKVMQISDSLKERWAQEARSIDRELVQEIKSYVENELEASLQAEIRLKDAAVALSNEEAGLADDFVKGATVGTILVSLAFLGPAVTQITLIGLASSILPVAVIGGVVNTLYKKNKIKNADLKECQELYKGITKSVMHLRDELVEEAEKTNPFETLSSQIMSVLQDTVMHQFKLQDQVQFGQLSEEMEAYQMHLNSLKERLMMNMREEANPQQEVEIDQDLLDLLG